MPSRAKTELLNAFGEPFYVEEREDIGECLPPEDFWSRVERHLPAGAADRSSSRLVWDQDFLRRAFFGIDPALPRQVRHLHDNLPVLSGLLGVTCREDDPKLVVAADLPYHPIMTMHPASTGSYSRKYYPRRQQDWIIKHFHPAYILTGDHHFLSRLEELCEFLLYSQYDHEGRNQFTETFYPDEYAALKAQGLPQQWYGGWDYLFDWEWLDAYGYTWHLHEPDHHVNSHIAVAMIRAYEVTGKERYLQAAAAFVYNQVPRYGWHTGIWNGRRYYWTEYNPSGAGHPTLDATDNIQALVAHAAAMLGYHLNDARLLEYARGLIWYLVREFTVDGRWYYDGAENPRNRRRAVSHDMSCLYPALGALPYLYKAGLELDPELEGIETAWDWYKQDEPEKVYQVVGRIPGNDEAVQVAIYLQSQGSGADVFKVPALAGIPDGEGYGISVRLTKLVPPTAAHPHWQAASGDDLTPVMTPQQLSQGIKLPFALQKGEVARLAYTVPLAGAQPPADLLLTVPETSYLSLPARIYFPFPAEVEATLRLPDH
ncbi:MAG TPA: hypothetical protein GXX29_07585 [Firmicutes bacterium]|nr:hypothetical protein [Bacillota bacterium]